MEAEMGGCHGRSVTPRARVRLTKRVSAGEVESADVLWWRWRRMVEEEEEGVGWRGAIGFVEAWVVGGKNCGLEVR
jgi:hypothetical protein